MPTGISWTQETWNPTTGCDRVSPGCDNCYALDQAARLKRMGVKAYQNDGGERSGPGFKLTFHPNRLTQPSKWRTPRRIFVNSMSDLFHGDLDFEQIDAICAAMRAAPQHEYQVLTKRPHFAAHCFSQGLITPPPNFWLGVSIESRDYLWRLDILRSIGRVNAFLSLEPLLEVLGELDLTPDPNRTDVGWVIVGGESGPKRRPFDKQWARNIRGQCLDYGIPFFFKQGSALRPGQDRVLDGRTWDEMPA